MRFLFMMDLARIGLGGFDLKLNWSQIAPTVPVSLRHSEMYFAEKVYSGNHHLHTEDTGAADPRCSMCRLEDESSLA